MQQTDEELARLAEPLQRLQEQTAAEVTSLEAKLAAARDRHRRVGRALRELLPQEPKPKRTKAKAKPVLVSDRVLNLVGGAIMDGHETVKDIIEATELSESSVGNAIRALREEESIRKAGVREGTMEAIYKPMTVTDLEAVNG
jgi:DNA-binding transcriptional ArsR family regulator